MVVKLILLNSEEKAQCIDSARFDVIILVKNKPSLVIQHEGVSGSMDHSKPWHKQYMEEP